MALNKLKSMQDSLLEYVVFNFFNVFYDSYDIEIKQLPPCLFERIIFKSKELRWPINLDTWRNFVPVRNVLCWKNIDLTLLPRYSAEPFLDEDILKTFNKVDYPVKTLSLRLHTITDEGMKNLAALGSNLESLDLTYLRREANKFPNNSFPKLKRLHIANYSEHGKNKFPIKLNLKKFSKSLEELKLENEYVNSRTFKSIAHLKNLKVLSLPYTIVRCETFFTKILSSLQQLRSLDLRRHLTYERCNWPDVEALSNAKLLHAISEMPNLVNLDLTWPNEEDEDLLRILKCKKWKKFGMHRALNYRNYFCPPYDETKLFADEVYGMYSETILATCETHIKMVDCAYTMSRHLINLLVYMTPDQIKFRSRAENALLNYIGCAKFSRSGVLEECQEYLKSGRATKDFITKLLHIIGGLYDNRFYKEYRKYINVPSVFFCYDDVMKIFSVPYVADVVFEIIRKSLNKVVSWKMFAILYFVIEMQARKLIDKLGLNYIFERWGSLVVPHYTEVDEDTFLGLRKILDNVFDRTVNPMQYDDDIE